MGRGAQPPLIGRDAELASLRRHFHSGGTSAVLLGSPGVGKTRLARAVLDLDAATGRDTAAVIGGSSVAMLPFAPVADLLPKDAPGGDPLALLREATAHLAERATSRPLTLSFDDAHLLDPGSLALLGRVAEIPGVRMVCTVRSGEPVPAEIENLWKDADALRLDLAPLERAAAEALATAVVGGPPDADAAHLLWHLARGNPLYLRELLLGCREQGHLELKGARWRLTVPPAVTPRLIDLVASRLRGLESAARTALDTLAVLEPLGHAELSELVGAAVLARLEGTGLVEATQSGRRREVRFGHPVHAEVVRATMARAHRAEIAAALLRVLPDDDAARREDRVRLATIWRISDRRGRPELFLAAASASLAAAVHGQAAEFAAVAVDRGGGVEAQLTHAEALLYLGNGAEAERVLTAAAASATGDAQVTRIALLRFHDRAFNRGSPAQAEAVATSAREQVEDAGWRDRLDAARAMASLMQGDLTGALRSAEEVLRREHVDPATLLGILVVTSAAHVLRGDVGDALHDVRRAEPLIAPLGPVLPMAADQIGITEVLAHWHDARVTEAIELARRRVPLADPNGAATGAWTTTLAIVLLEAGRVEEAATTADDAMAALSTGDPLGLRPIAVAVAARAAAAVGDVAAADRLLAESGEGRGLDLRSRLHLDRARAWLLAARGESAVAMQGGLRQGNAAIDAGHVVWGAALLHDAVRLGAPERVLDGLQRIAAEHGCALLHLYARHAVSLAAADAPGLRRVARGFESGGMRLYAAEAMAQAADVLARQGLAGPARATAAVAVELARGCGPVASPSLLCAEDPVTAREREIAILASTGDTSREIAGSLGVSVRTIDNHLASVYRKTGIAGRHELSELFGRE